MSHHTGCRAGCRAPPPFTIKSSSLFIHCNFDSILCELLLVSSYLCTSFIFPSRPFIKIHFPVWPSPCIVFSVSSKVSVVHVHLFSKFLLSACLMCKFKSLLGLLSKSGNVSSLCMYSTMRSRDWYFGVYKPELHWSSNVVAENILNFCFHFVKVLYCLFAPCSMPLVAGYFSHNLTVIRMHLCYRCGLVVPHTAVNEHYFRTNILSTALQFSSFTLPCSSVLVNLLSGQFDQRPLEDLI